MQTAAFLRGNLLYFYFTTHITINIRKSNVFKVMLGSFLFSLALETLQVIEVIFSLTHVRVFDVDNIIANIIGGIIGYFFIILLSKIMKSRLKVRNIVTND